jgi:hypothetical protein
VKPCLKKKKRNISNKEKLKEQVTVNIKNSGYIMRKEVIAWRITKYFSSGTVSSWAKSNSIFIYLFAGVGMEPRAFHVLGKGSTTELYLGFLRQVLTVQPRLTLKASFELLILLPQPPKCWDYRCVLPCSALTFFCTACGLKEFLHFSKVRKNYKRIIFCEM